MVAVGTQAPSGVREQLTEFRKRENRGLCISGYMLRSSWLHAECLNVSKGSRKRGRKSVRLSNLLSKPNFSWYRGDFAAMLSGK